MAIYDGFLRFFGVRTPEKAAKQAGIAEQRLLSGAAVDELLLSRIFTVPNKTGQTINADTVLGLSTVWRAISVIANGVASLPVHVVQIENTDTGVKKTRALRHPVYRQVSFQPSVLYTKYDFFQTLITHALLYGNAYVELTRERVTGYPKTYTILPPERVTLKAKETGTLYYEVVQDTTMPGARPYEVRPANMVHIKGLSWNGMTGLQVIRMLADNFGLALANQEYLTKFFSEGATLAGILKHPGRLTTDAMGRLRASWENSYSGSKNAAKVAILEEGMDYAAIGLSPQQAGAADTKKLTISDIARIFGVPQFMLEDLDRATFNNIEHLSLLFITHTIRPWCKRIENELNIKLFPTDEQVIFQVEFDISDLQMSDLDSRSKWVESMMKWGILNRDEVREREGYNPIGDGTGQEYYVPMNMMNPAEPPQPEGTPQTDTNNEQGNENLPQ